MAIAMIKKVHNKLIFNTISNKIKNQKPNVKPGKTLEKIESVLSIKSIRGRFLTEFMALHNN